MAGQGACPMRVLYVEDNAMNRRVVRDMLTVAEVEMVEAEDAEIGLRKVEAEDFDLILMDLRMPGMDGLEAIRHIRARGDAKSRTAIVVVTADGGSELRDLCLSIGADEVISKPLALNAFFETLGEVMARREGVLV
jgi:CheY-like chemotaxis protein